MRRLTLLLALAVGATAVAVAPAGARPTERPATVVEALVGRSGGGALDSDHRDFDILVQAVLAADLDGALSDPGTDFTVFAPDDRAFMRTVAELTGSQPASEEEAFAAVAGFGIPTVTEVLLYHVVAGERLGLRHVLFADELAMANGGTVDVRYTRLVDADPDARDPRLRRFGQALEADNGTVHTIDRVLRPVDL